MTKNNYMKQRSRMTWLYGLLMALCIMGAVFCAIDLASDVAPFSNGRQLPISVVNLTENGTPLSTETLSIAGTIDDIEASATPAEYIISFTNSDGSNATNSPIKWGWIVKIVNQILMFVAYLLGTLGILSMMMAMRKRKKDSTLHITFFFLSGALMVCASLLEVVMSLLIAHGMDLMFAANGMVPQTIKVANILRFLFGSILILISLLLLANKKMEEDIELTI